VQRNPRERRGAAHRARSAAVKHPDRRGGVSRETWQPAKTARISLEIAGVPLAHGVSTQEISYRRGCRSSPALEISRAQRGGSERLGQAHDVSRETSWTPKTAGMDPKVPRPAQMATDRQMRQELPHGAEPNHRERPIRSTRSVPTMFHVKPRGRSSIPRKLRPRRVAVLHRSAPRWFRTPNHLLATPEFAGAEECEAFGSTPYSRAHRNSPARAGLHPPSPRSSLSFGTRAARQRPPAPQQRHSTAPARPSRSRTRRRDPAARSSEPSARAPGSRIDQMPVADTRGSDPTPRPPAPRGDNARTRGRDSHDVSRETSQRRDRARGSCPRSRQSPPM